MLFQLVTGRLPFEADSALAIAYAHVQEQPVTPSSINRSLPPAVDALVARALKKNPNERFPSAETMRDECLRVAQSLQAAAPSIVPGARTSSGAGVGSAVFPPVDQAIPTPGPVQTPYQPGPYGAPTPPPAPSQAYGYPQQGGYPTPGVPAYAPQQGVSTPQPYHLTPQHQTSVPGGPGGRKGNKAVVVCSIVVALVAIGGLMTALALRNEHSDDQGSGGSSPSPSVVAGHKGPETSKTIDKEKCTSPQTSYNDPDKIEIPDFQYKNLTSVKACFRAAGWHMKIKKVNETTFGQDTIMDQFPSAGDDVDPKDMPDIELSVSTGNPG
jgi:serine/threonine protein kinase